VIKAEFSALLLQSSVSHDPSEISLMWRFDAQETFMINVNAKKNTDKLNSTLNYKTSIT